ncbi:MAG: prolipoprotein diacylglyceryl transferase [Saprospiraceae bacterium]|nr:prolipoprotein diacylglyceryl transferase [Saprospiraceae bacterium]
MLHQIDISDLQLNWNAISRNAGELAVLVFLLVCWRVKLLRAHWPAFFLLSAFFVLAGLSGARLFSLFNISLSRGVAFQWDLLLKNPGFGALRWNGSMLLYALFLPVVLLAISSVSRWKSFDLFALSTCLFIVFVKLGCQFSGDGCYGIPTTLPWGMHYEWGIRPSRLPVHPTPLYDSFFHLLFFVYLLRRWKSGAPDGRTGLLFFVGSAGFCFLLECIRVNTPVALGLTLAQWTYLAILPICWLTNQYRIFSMQTDHNLKPALPCY